MLALLCTVAVVAAQPPAAQDEVVQERSVETNRPNILWITCEDISAHLGSYGCADAITPALDRLAAEGVRYSQAFAPIGVCAPARSCLITGMYPNSIGTQHMRCRGRWPAGVRGFPAWLRDTGYFTSNRRKTDYNLPVPQDAWDRNGGKAHWRQRKAGQPFFSVINFTTTHESGIRLASNRFAKRTSQLAPHERRDPTSIAIPPYHPDLPAVRRDWANYHELITALDKQVAEVVEQLADDGLADDTIVFFFSDHGAGMPRSKRWLFDSGMHVPLIVRFGKNVAHLAPSGAGTTSKRLVSFVDFAATVLSLGGVEVPDYMQGVPFLGASQSAPRRYVHGFRGRMDERFDMQRAVRDERYKYIRNFRPHRRWAQHIDYMWQMPTMRAWQRLMQEGRGTTEQRRFFATKPIEELYDTWADPHELNNLAARPDHALSLIRLRGELARWMHQVVDLGLLPEAELRRRYAGRSEYDAVRADPASYPLAELLDAARLVDPAASDGGDVDNRLHALIVHADPAMRWWGWTAIAARVQSSSKSWIESARKALTDPSPTVRIAAAEALCRLGHPSETLPTLLAATHGESEWDALRALTLADRLDGAAESMRTVFEKLAASKTKYLARVAKKALADLDR
ncbi:MAG: sulfatase-like hydrolase/transferase [Planctomycetota bacterium]|nr:sulfatase-like hydrolase/transferase [Planctomycetota bacterium]